MAVEASLSNRRFLSSAYDDRAASDRVAMKGIASQTGHCSSESRPVIQAASGALPSSRPRTLTRRKVFLMNVLMPIRVFSPKHNGTAPVTVCLQSLNWSETRLLKSAGPVKVESA